jgi:predicted DNA-binding protein
MGKKIVSFSLSKETIDMIDKMSKVTGKSKSQLIEELIGDFKFSPELERDIQTIIKLQKKVTKEI